MRIAIANLKGGVGKSTTTLILAEYLAVFENLRVLVVDLDPQSNSSFMLLSSQGVDLAEAQHKTLSHFLLNAGKENEQTAGSYVYTGASNLTELDKTYNPHKKGKIDILPSIPKLWFVEYNLTQKLYENSLNPKEWFLEKFSNGLDTLAGSYDLVLIDCPPGFSMLTRSGLMISDLIISPTIADEVSARSLKDFKEIGIKEMLGKKATDNHHVIISKFNSTKHTRRVLEYLKKYYDVIEPPIRYSNEIVNAAYFIDISNRRSFANKYSRMQNDIIHLGRFIYRNIIKSEVMKDAG